jgi:predicted Holliday junction resolvase-like endonuclease
MTEKNVIIILTGLMIINALILIFYVLSINKMQVENKKRDLYYAQRFDEVENMIKQHFLEIFKIIKKI